jgi:hypothetical protein
MHVEWGKDGAHILAHIGLLRLIISERLEWSVKRCGEKQGLAFICVFGPFLEQFVTESGTFENGVPCSVPALFTDE